MKYLQRTIGMALLYVFGAVANLVQMKIENNETQVFQVILDMTIILINSSLQVGGSNLNGNT